MCCNACKHQFILHRNEWCHECRTEDDEAMDRAYEDHVLEREADAFASITPASDVEWLARLSEIAPKVGDQAVEFRRLRLRPMPPGRPLPRYSDDDSISLDS